MKTNANRCSNEQRFALQFHTDRFDDDERYESGELIDDPVAQVAGAWAARSQPSAFATMLHRLQSDGRAA